MVVESQLEHLGADYDKPFHLEASAHYDQTWAATILLVTGIWKMLIELLDYKLTGADLITCLEQEKAV